MKRIPVSLFLIVLISMVILSCSPKREVKESRSIEIPAKNIEFIEIYNGAGEVDIIGAPEAETIRAQVDIIVTGSGDSDLEGLIEREAVVEMEKRGNRAVANAQFTQSFFLSELIDRSEKKIHLQLSIPPAIEIRVWDGEGDLYLQNIQNDVSIQDESGDIVIEDAIGNIDIHDGRGLIVGSRITGSITITDLTGDIEISHIDGAIDINDEQGSITIASITGNITVEDTTGAVTVEQVKGNLRLIGGGKGSVRLRGVSGDVIQNY